MSKAKYIPKGEVHLHHWWDTGWAIVSVTWWKDLESKIYLGAACLPNRSKANRFQTWQKGSLFCACILVWFLLWTIPNPLQCIRNMYVMDTKETTTSRLSSRTLKPDKNSRNLTLYDVCLILSINRTALFQFAGAPLIAAVYSSAQFPENNGELMGSAVGFWTSSSCIHNHSPQNISNRLRTWVTNNLDNGKDSLLQGDQEYAASADTWHPVTHTKSYTIKNCVDFVALQTLKDVY